MILFKLGEIFKRRGWFTYEVKAKYSSCVDDATEPTGDSSINAKDKEDAPSYQLSMRAKNEYILPESDGEWGYRNEELGVIPEENKIV